MPSTVAQPVNWIEIVKILAPYLTAILALIGVFVTAYLSQRNWMKQFGKQQSVLLFEKRLEIAYDVLRNGLAASNHSMASLINYLMARTLISLNSLGHQFSQEIIDNFISIDEQENNIQLEALKQLVILGYMLTAMFNNDLKKEHSRCLQLFNEVAEIRTKPGTIINEIKNAFTSGTEIDLLISTGTSIITKNLDQIATSINEGISKLVSDMLEYAKAN
jgi:hypothetical protein